MPAAPTAFAPRQEELELNLPPSFDSLEDERQHRKHLVELQAIAAALSNGGSPGSTAAAQAAEFERQRRVLEAMEKPDRRYP